MSINESKLLLQYSKLFYSYQSVCSTLYSITLNTFEYRFIVSAKLLKESHKRNKFQFELLSLNRAINENCANESTILQTKLRIPFEHEN